MCHLYPLLVQFLQTHLSLPGYCDIIPMYCKANFHLKFHIRDNETGNLQQSHCIKNWQFGRFLISFAFKKEDRYGTSAITKNTIQPTTNGHGEPYANSKAWTDSCFHR
jgi:hypothetical protein